MIKICVKDLWSESAGINRHISEDLGLALVLKSILRMPQMHESSVRSPFPNRV